MPEVFERLELDGKPVHVPAGDELRELAVQQRDLHEDVLEHHVEEVPHVQVAVRVGRAIVQDPRPVRGVTLQAPLVGAMLPPPRDALRLALGQVGLHRKVCLGKIQRRAIVRGIRHRSMSSPEHVEVARRRGLHGLPASRAAARKARRVLRRADRPVRRPRRRSSRGSPARPQRLGADTRGLRRAPTPSDRMPSRETGRRSARRARASAAACR